VNDKLRIAATFAAAAPGYDAHAHVQRHVAQQLAARVHARWPQLQRVVEIGCGTGNLTTALHQAYPEADLLATDIAQAMVAACTQRVATAQADGAVGGGQIRFAVADGEHLDVHGADLVVSSLVFQWFADQGAAVRRLAAQAPRLAVATLLDGTFAEWKAAHATLGVPDGVRDFMAEPTLRALCAEIGGHWVVETVHEHDPDVLQFVRGLKAIGASTARPGHQPVPLRSLLRAFPQGITVSYRVAYLLAKNTSVLGR
jgi:malonyl-CoA O-methyltransferase